MTAIYARKLVADLDGAQRDQVREIAKGGIDRLFNAKEMQEPFGLKYTATNKALQDLVLKGYVEETTQEEAPRKPGRPSRVFHFTGAARLALGVLSTP